MIDLITLVKSNLPQQEVLRIVEKNGLQTNSKNGEAFYDNASTKNLTQQKGVFIRIETNNNLKVECSLHKYFNEISGRERSNCNLFSMSDAKKTIDSLLSEKAVAVENTRVYNYEIGLNLNVSKDCIMYLDKMKSIGPAGSEKLLYVNPKYKNERARTTVFHKHTRKHFKAYDKVFESIDKKAKYIPDGNILRIETVNKRLDNCTVIDFFNPDNLKKMIESFFKDWRTVQFKRDIITPKGTGRARQYLCLEIIDKGKEAVLYQAKEQYKNGSLKEWEYRNIREFVTHEWDEIKGSLSFVESDEEKEFKHLMKINYILLRNDELIV